MSEQEKSLLQPKFTRESAEAWVKERFFTLNDPYGKPTGILAKLAYKGCYLKRSEPFGERTLRAIIFHTFEASVKNNPRFKKYGLILEDQSRHIHPFSLKKMQEFIDAADDLNQ